MSVAHSALLHEPSDDDAPSVAAIVYPDEAFPDAAFRSLVGHCRARGLSLAGVLQHLVSAEADRRCDMLLEDLTSGHHTALFEDRGVGARGCRLDEAALAEASVRIEGALEGGPDLLVLNKFGKAECEGRGLRDLIVSAIDRGIPVIIGVPKRNLETWRAFTGDFAVELMGADGDIERWLRRFRNGRPNIDS
jgi:nucleoside-triphosphatase THEP1